MKLLKEELEFIVEGGSGDEWVSICLCKPIEQVLSEIGHAIRGRGVCTEKVK